MNKKSVHFVGIKGVGMTPLAIIAKEAGFIVSGSDIENEFITDDVLLRAGIKPALGFSKENIGNADLVIVTGAHGGFDNEEVKEAKIRKIPVITQGEAVGLFMKGSIFGRDDFIGISVAGSHGKTTTTAMLATVLKKNDLDPSFLVGTGDVASLGSCGHYGKGRYFVAEADEYATEPKYNKEPKFLSQHPKIAVFTNIEFDHPDIFPTVVDIRKAFLVFARQLPKDGLLIANADDLQTGLLLREYSGRVITFGLKSSNDYYVSNVQIKHEKTFFQIISGKTVLGDFVISVPGEHNALNALAASVALAECGLTYDQIRKGLAYFRGTKRRFEFKGKFPSGGLLYDDYAHHPTEIRKTLLAFRKSFPDNKIVCIFQPHTYSRTKNLLNEFALSFSDADILAVTPIYPSLREKPDPEISSRLLVDRVKKNKKDAKLLRSLSDVVEYIEQNNFKKDTVVVTMGAGDIYTIANSLKLK